MQAGAEATRKRTPWCVPSGIVANTSFCCSGVCRMHSLLSSNPPSPWEAFTNRCAHGGAVLSGIIPEKSTSRSAIVWLQEPCKNVIHKKACQACEYACTLHSTQHLKGHLLIIGNDECWHLTMCPVQFPCSFARPHPPKKLKRLSAPPPSPPSQHCQ